MRRVLASAAIVMLAACNPVANFSAGEERIEQFQDLYSAAEYDAMYAATGPQFREVTSRADFQNLMDVLEARLGVIESTEQSGFNVNSNLNGTFTVVTMNTTFAQGQGVETYTFSGGEDDFELVGYLVNSDRLLVTVDDLAPPSETEDAVAAE